KAEDREASIQLLQGELAKVLGSEIGRETRYWNVGLISKVTLAEVPRARNYSRNPFDQLEAFKNQNVQKSFDQYMLDFHLLQGLFMIGLYHQNPMTDCLQNLQRFAPEAVLAAEVQKPLERLTLIDELKNYARSEVFAQCVRSGLHPGLKTVGF